MWWGNKDSQERRDENSMQVSTHNHILENVMQDLLSTHIIHAFKFITLSNGNLLH
jgi:hypothetical protein